MLIHTHQFVSLSCLSVHVGLPGDDVQKRSLQIPPQCFDLMKAAQDVCVQIIPPSVAKWPSGSGTCTRNRSTAWKFWAIDIPSAPKKRRYPSLSATVESRVRDCHSVKGRPDPGNQPTPWPRAQQGSGHQGQEAMQSISRRGKIDA